MFEPGSIREMCESAVRAAPVAMLLVDEHLCVKFSNHKASELFGINSDQLLACSLMDLLPDVSLESAAGSLWRHLQQPSEQGEVVRLSAHTSARFGQKPVELSLSAHRQGPLCFTWLSLLDLSERQAIESQLQEALSRIDFTAQAYGLGNWLWSAHSDVTHWDRRMRDLFALSTEGRSGAVPFAHWVALVLPEDREAFEQHWLGLIEQGATSVWAYRVIRQDGELRWIRTAGLAGRDPEGNLTSLVGVSHDVTEVMSAQTRMYTLNTSLKQQVLRRDADSERIGSELDAFSYAVSHDLRAPLRAIDGYSDILLKSYGSRLDEQGREFLRKSKAASQRLGVLIDDLLSLARISRAGIRVQDVDMSRMAEQVVQDLRQTQAGRPVQVAIQAGMVVRADAAMMRTLLNNLLGNAWKFTHGRPLARIEFGSQAHDGRTEFYIRDNGAGFDMAFGDKLFIAFQRLHQAHEFPGSGMGLVTAHRILSRHKGGIRAIGEVGQGASFYFWLGEPEAEDEI